MSGDEERQKFRGRSGARELTSGGDFDTPRSVLDDEDSDDEVIKVFACPPFRRSRKYNKDGAFRGLWLVKWAVPAFCFCVSTFICMWFLHVGTFYYIHVMERQESVLKLIPPTNLNMTKFGYPFLSPGLTPGSTSFGSLEDPAEGCLGWVQVDMGNLDAVSAALPAAWFVLTIATDDLQHWTKVIICNCLLAILKGAFGFMTVVPDSIGWASCKARLKPEGIERMKDEIAPLKDGFFGVFWSTLTFEVNNLFGKLSGAPSVRFCADMMYSGHTYFTTLYALGLCELARQHFRFYFSDPWRTIVVLMVYAVCLLEQVVEISLVLRNRFHYTMDVAMAILLTLLFFTNGSIGTAAKAWHHWSGDPRHFGWKYATIPESVRNEGRSVKNTETGKLVLQWVHEHKRDWMLLPKSYFREHGDTWTPPCCFPFCCFWGPRYIFDDSAIKMAHNIFHERGDESSDDDQDV